MGYMDRYHEQREIILKDRSELRPGDLCLILWKGKNNAPRWIKAKLIKILHGTSDIGQYKILKTGEIIARGRYCVKPLKPKN